MDGPKSPDTTRDFDEWVNVCISSRLSRALGDCYTAIAQTYEHRLYGAGVEITVYRFGYRVFHMGYPLFGTDLSEFVTDIKIALGETELKL